MSVHLVVEGKDDYFVLKALLEAAGVGSCCWEGESEKDAPFRVSETGGRDMNDVETRNRILSVKLRDSKYERVGLILDADRRVDLPAGDSLKACWQSLQDLLTKTEIRSRPLFHAPPLDPAPDGTVLKSEAGLVIGVWIWPDNTRDGILEDFLGELIPADDRYWAHASLIVDQLQRPRLFSDAAAPKAKIHTWLAWQKRPGRPTGTAITAKFLKHQSPQAKKLLNWLVQLQDTPIP